MEHAGVDQCRPWPTIAVNDAYRLAPWADVLYACDGRWWQHHVERVRDSGFAGQLWTQDAQAAQRYGLRRVVCHFRAGLCRVAGQIHAGDNSGHQAINLAWHFGYRRFVLLGFDCRQVDGQRHWFGNHPGAMNLASDYPAWVRHFGVLARDLAAEGCEVINCSPVSALPYWPKMSVEEALAGRLPHPRAA